METPVCGKKKASNRTPITCPICHKTQKELSTHLRRTCMKYRPIEDIRKIVAEARKNFLGIAATGMAFDYNEIMTLGTLENVVTFLERRGFLIKNKPAVRRNVPQREAGTSLALSASSAQSIPAPGLSPLSVLEERLSARCNSPGPDEINPIFNEEESAEDDQEENTTEQLEESAREDQKEKNRDELEEIATDEQEESAPEEQEQDGLEESAEETSAIDQKTKNILMTKWSTVSRIKMKDAGLYHRHSLDSDLLKGFASYLKDTLAVSNYNQEVEDVARFLYYMNPSSASLEFVKDIEKTNSFFTKLREMNLTNQTMFNYLKHIRRFVSYQMKATNLSIKKPKLFQACTFFSQVTNDIQKRISKGISREVVSKRYTALISSTKTPDECRRLLDVAKQSFLKSLLAAKKPRMLDNSKLEIIYYLEALLVLKHLQRPGVVKNMTVSEWQERIPHAYCVQGSTDDLVVIAVKMHKTATQQVAAFALTKEEERWFEVYYEKVRPSLVLDNSAKDTFFLSTSGRKIFNVSNDLRRYHERFDLPNISSQLVRRVCETWTVSEFTDSEKSLFARYLAHTNMTAERSYREKTLQDICHASKLVAHAGGTSASESQGSQSKYEEPVKACRRSSTHHSSPDQATTSRYEQPATAPRRCSTRQRDADQARFPNRTQKSQKWIKVPVVLLQRIGD